MQAATIDWCETNFAVVSSIAEFWNTISNVSFIGFALVGLRQIGHLPRHEYLRFRAQFLSVIAIGIGSALFHATMVLVAQQADESPMVWSILTWTLIIWAKDMPDWLERVLPYCLAVYGVAFSIAHAFFRWTTFFQCHFGLFVALNIGRLAGHYRACRSPAARRVLVGYVAGVLAGTAFWLVDFHFCEVIATWPINPQGHAIWHAIMGSTTYLGPLFMLYVHTTALGIPCEMRFWCKLFPYLAVLNTKVL